MCTNIEMTIYIEPNMGVAPWRSLWQLVFITVRRGHRNQTIFRWHAVGYRHYLPFFIFFISASCWSTAAPKSVKMIPACELTPTAVTSILPEPSITCVPDRTIGSKCSPFLTWSDSPVNEDSSTYKDSYSWVSLPT